MRIESRMHATFDPGGPVADSVSEPGTDITFDAGDPGRGELPVIASLQSTGERGLQVAPIVRSGGAGVASERRRDAFCRVSLAASWPLLLKDLARFPWHLCGSLG